MRTRKSCNCRQLVKKGYLGLITAKFPIPVEKRPGHLSGQGAEGGFAVSTCAFGYVEGVFLKDLK